MSVSVIIPAYRAAATIGRALESLLAQKCPPDEIIVVDDGSPDDLAAAVAPYQSRITLLRKANGGASSARNRGIDHCRGDWIAFIDADDYWEPAKLERQLEVGRRHPEVGLIASRFFRQPVGAERFPGQIGPDGMVDRVLRPRGADIFEVAFCLWTSTVLVRRAALGQRRFDEGLVTAEDRDLWIRLVADGATYLLGERLATSVAQPGSLTWQSPVELDCANMLRVVRRHGELLGRRGVYQWETRIYRQWAGSHLSERRPDAALGPAWRRFCRQPWSAEAWWVLGKCALWAGARRASRGRKPPESSQPQGAYAPRSPVVQ
jgi:glycosyltransferase involved in cell wall biosynthesis